MRAAILEEYNKNGINLAIKDADIPNPKENEVFEENKIRPSIDKIYKLDEINDALKKVATGSSCGKTIIKVFD